MSTAKRQQTMAKRNRERAVEEKRTLKRLKKQAARAEKAAGGLGEPESDAEFRPERDADSGPAAESAPESAPTAASEPDAE